MVKKLPKSLRKFIRLEKARIRRETSDFKTQEKLINDLYQKFLRTRNPVSARGQSSTEICSSTGLKTK